MALTRRNFLKLAGLGGAGLILGLRPDGATAGVAWAAARVAPTLKLLAPARSLSPATVAGFTASARIGVQLVQGAPTTATRGYDLVVAPVPALIQLIEHHQVRELESMDTPLLEQRVYDPLNAFSLPAARGAIGINTRGRTPPGSWAEFFALTRTLPAYLPLAETFHAALKSLGHSINTRNPFARADAQSLVSSLRSSPFKQAALALGPSFAADGWTFTLPTEGAESWEDCFCIPADSQYPDLAHAFIRFALAAQPLAPLPPGVLEPLSPFASI